MERIVTRSRRRTRLVVLIDVDNTLIDDQAIQRDFRRHLERALGKRDASFYWRLVQSRRQRFGFADYLGALQRYRQSRIHQAHALEIASFLIDYPFRKRLFPGALQAMRRLRRWGEVVIVSDGDVVFQPHKIERAGLVDAANGCVLVYVHKERELADIAARHPAKRYVVFDDSATILARIKRRWRDRCRTVLVRDSRLKRARSEDATPRPDIVIDAVAAFTRAHLERLLGAHSTSSTRRRRAARRKRVG
jgi:FMN phosphatase YigB (HAD superfamily)